MLHQLLQSPVVKAVIGFAVLALFFTILESVWPEDRLQPRLRRGTLTDAVYFFVLIPLTRLLSTVAIAVGIFITVRLLPSVHVPYITTQPIWAQGLEIVALGDLIGYWTHRLFHINRLLWPFHAIHHSSEQVDWLSSVRVHPLDTTISKLAQTLPLFLLGFTGSALAPYTLFLALYPIVLHANLNWSYGPFRYVIASPAFHRWHHAAEEVALFKNYAGLFPVWDVLFGTAYFPARRPVAYGLYQERMSNNVFAQLWYPFRRRAGTTPAP